MNVAQMRRKARQRALQALYRWRLNPQSARDIQQEFLQTQDMDGVDMEYFSELLRECIARADDLDRLLGPYLDIPVPQLDPVEHSILRMSLYELMQRPDIPYRVVINEAIDLAKKFGAEQGHKFVNGALDKAARELRPHEN
ncbi:MAG TPA: transcription antitermination factor NusB [Gammaproteobacteria bacterium]|nr:transcription antitermination factor NusB [Gammaproteobacteria bacterium]